MSLHIFVLKSSPPHLSQDDNQHIHQQAPHYLLITGVLYRRGCDTIFLHCLTYKEVEWVLNHCHANTCSFHLSGMETTQKIIRTSYYWSIPFCDNITAVNHSMNC